jgi:hypothetical protein
VHSRLGRHIHSVPAREGPSDDSGCPLTPVEGLAAPISPRRVSSASLAGPVDAPALPRGAVEELAAPSVQVLLDPCSEMVNLVLHAVGPDDQFGGTHVDIAVVQEVASTLAGQSAAVSCNDRVSSGLLFGVSQQNVVEEPARTKSLTSGVSFGSVRWNAKPPCFKVYSIRVRSLTLADQDDTLV